jgi:hypothetical protein
VVSRKGIKRERGACTPAQCRGCPRNCKRRASDLIATGSLRASGKVVDGDDPRARRPATAGVTRGRSRRGVLMWPDRSHRAAQR